jgi:peptidoglycan/xylan/chitin deacetylase (PgdA/CDA1 family)
LKNILEELEVHRGKGINSHSMLTWDDIKAMRGSGISFASHGMYHSILTTLTPEQAQFEIVSSKHLIKEKTGIDVSFFSYPNGEPNDFNKEIIEMLKSAGYLAACSLIKGVNKNTSLFALRRYCVTYGMVSNMSGNFSKCLFEAKTSGIY